MSNNLVEFIINKIKKSDDEFWSDYSNEGYEYECLKRDVIECVYEYTKNEITLFKKKRGTKFVKLTQNKFFEQKTDEDLAKIMEFELKKKVEDFIKSKFNDSEISLCLEHNCEELVERQIELIQENDVIEKIKNNLEQYSLKLFDENLQDNLNYRIKEAVKEKSKDINNLFH